MESLYAPVIFMTKLSILLQYIQIFIPNRRGRSYLVVYILIWTNLLYFIAAFILSVAQCIPRAKIWKPYIPGRCVSNAAVIVVTGIFNLLSDVSILLLPMIWTWRLHMPLRQKIKISAVFAVGALLVQSRKITTMSEHVLPNKANR